MNVIARSLISRGRDSVNGAIPFRFQESHKPNCIESRETANQDTLYKGLSNRTHTISLSPSKSIFHVMTINCSCSWHFCDPFFPELSGYLLSCYSLVALVKTESF
jgi:hypothetical protein